MTKLQFYNSLSQKKEEFKNIKEDNVEIYTCGPTVYDFAHIGNLRAYIFADTLTRILQYNGYKTNWTMNVTDVDDKTIAASKEKFPELEPKEALKRFTQEYENYFLNDLKKLNIRRPDHIPKATETIAEMQELIKSLSKSGYAYEKEGSIYFNIKKYAEKYSYGQLVDLDLSQIKPGVRVSTDEYEKENVNDFVLWKAQKAGEPSWSFEIGGKSFPGRPGWHIECSAMSKKHLGVPFDIHTGGIDLKFPHHEDELAQTSAGCGCAKPVNYWIHNEHLLVDNKKMSKSLGNFYTLFDIEKKKYSPLDFRFLCLGTHYRSKMNFTWESLEAARHGLEHLRNQIRALDSRLDTRLDTECSSAFEHRVSKCGEKFISAINDDLNTPRALAVAQELLKSDLPEEEKMATILDFDKIFGLGLSRHMEITVSEKISLKDEIFLVQMPKDTPEEVKELSERRAKARQEKNWSESDVLREQVRSLGYEIEDFEKGYTLKKR
ncbi:MAG TPA: cysteine--tRNA ligase [Candidatus Campbellbacteria bacterium]|nr:cysteine--tRNA ligase [Candidatus Campbellbacteria bacterium]